MLGWSETSLKLSTPIRLQSNYHWPTIQLLRVHKLSNARSQVDPLLSQLKIHFFVSVVSTSVALSSSEQWDRKYSTAFVHQTRFVASIRRTIDFHLKLKFILQLTLGTEAESEQSFKSLTAENRKLRAALKDARDTIAANAHHLKFKCDQLSSEEEKYKLLQEKYTKAKIKLDLLLSEEMRNRKPETKKDPVNDLPFPIISLKCAAFLIITSVAITFLISQ